MANEVKAKKLKRKRLAWNEASEAVLLDLWPDRLEELCGQRKNGKVYAEMAGDLAKLGFCYSPRDVQVKLQNFKQRYKKERSLMGVSGGSPSTWSQYGRVHQIIGSKTNLFTEHTLKSTDCMDSSITSILSSPLSPFSISSSPLPPASPLPDRSTSASSIEPARKKRKLEFRSTIMENFKNFSTSISEHLKKSEESKRELIEIEKRKADTLDKIAKYNEEIKNALISFLNKN